MSSLSIIEFIVSLVVSFVGVEVIGVVTERIWSYLPDIFTGVWKEYGLDILTSVEKEPQTNFLLRVAQNRNYRLVGL